MQFKIEDRMLLVLALTSAAILVTVLAFDALAGFAPLLPAFVIGGGTVLITALLVQLGIRAGPRSRTLRCLVAVGWVMVLALVLTIIALSEDPSLRLLGLPISTALVFFGFSVVPLWLLIACFALFRKAVFGPEEEARLRTFATPTTDAEEETE